MKKVIELRAPYKKQLPDQHPGPITGVIIASITAIMISVQTTKKEVQAYAHHTPGLCPARTAAMRLPHSLYASASFRNCSRVSVCVLDKTACTRPQYCRARP